MSPKRSCADRRAGSRRLPTRGRTVHLRRRTQLRLRARRQRGLPAAGEALDLSNVAGCINGSEPVTPGAVTKFIEAFAPYGLAKTAIKPSYGMAEATLSCHHRPGRRADRGPYLDREAAVGGPRRPVDPGAAERRRPRLLRTVVRSQWAAIVDSDTARSCPTATSAKSGCTATTSVADTGDARTRPTHVRQQAAGAAAEGSHAEGAADDGSGCAPATSASTSTASSTSPAASRT